MRHRATPRFWHCYRNVPDEVRRLADRCFQMLRRDPGHPSLHFKKSAAYGPRGWVSIIVRWPWKTGTTSFGFGSGLTLRMTSFWGELDLHILPSIYSYFTG